MLSISPATHTPLPKALSSAQRSTWASSPTVRVRPAPLTPVMGQLGPRRSPTVRVRPAPLTPVTV